MIIHPLSSSESPPLTPLAHDWHGVAVTPAVWFGFGVNGDDLIFAARRSEAALVHPEASPGRFQEHLWKYDVAEFFLHDPLTDHYLEFNLSPNGAHWWAGFSAPRMPAQMSPRNGDSGIRSEGDYRPHEWSARASVPLPWLRHHWNFGESTRLNATFILNSPNQVFLSAHPLGGGEPDFHRPAKFPPVQLPSE